LLRVHVEVYGCSANHADAEIASGILAEAGNTLVRSDEEADVSVILTCVVKTPTEVKIARRIGGLSASGHRLVVAGCMPKVERGLVERIAPGASLVGPDDLARVVEAVEEASMGRRGVYLDGSSPDRTLLPRARGGGVIHIAPISAGCLGSCSYCIVKLARGRLRSFSPERIVTDAESAIHSGCREIWVTAEDTAAYDSDGVRLPELLWMLSRIEGRFVIRVGMMTPSSALPILGELTKAFRGEKVYKFLHVPVQSGSDDVLARMRRRYTASEFRELVTSMRGAVPGLSVSTDLICGFPGETEEEFGETVSLLEWLRPDALNISRFWPRPGTEAEGLPGKLNGRVTKARSRVLNKAWIGLQMESTERWLGWEGEMLIDEEGRRGTKVGRNKSYRAIVVETPARLGEWAKVKVTSAGSGFLFGQIQSRSS
jgi:MiaB-like tRNA modifying enzyme